MREILAQLEQTLAQAVADPRESRSSGCRLATADAAALPCPIRRLPLGRGASETVLATLRQAQVSRPDGPPSAPGRGAWSYAELDAPRASWPATCGRSAGRRGDVVAIYGHRTASLVGAMLGVLKAGEPS